MLRSGWLVLKYNLNMKIPTSIEVYGETWQVKQLKDMNETLAGLCSKPDQTIYLNPAQNKKDILFPGGLEQM